MNDDQLSQLMKDIPVASDEARNRHITSTLDNFSLTETHSRRRTSRVPLWSVAAAALLVVGAGIGVSLQSLTDDDPDVYANEPIESLGGMSGATDTDDQSNPATVKGAPPAIGPCDVQYAEEKFVTIVRIGTERVAIYAMSTSTEPIVRLVDPNTCDELAIARR
jgi:hypothetical protein